MGHRLFATTPQLVVTTSQAAEHAQAHLNTMRETCNFLAELIRRGDTSHQPELTVAQLALAAAELALQQLKEALKAVLEAERAHTAYLEIEMKARTAITSATTPPLPEPRL